MSKYQYKEIIGAYFQNKLSTQEKNIKNVTSDLTGMLNIHLR